MTINIDDDNNIISNISVDRIDNKLSHIKNNCRLMCVSCNCSKSGDKKRSPIIIKDDIKEQKINVVEDEEEKCIRIQKRCKRIWNIINYKL